MFLINLTFYESGTVYCAVNQILARELLKTSQVHTQKRVLLSPLCFLILISLIYNGGCFETCDQRDQNEDHSLKMLVDINKCFRLSVPTLSPLNKSTMPLSILIVICVATQPCFWPLFARQHHFEKMVHYTTLQLFKQIPLGIIGLSQYKLWGSFSCMRTLS